MSPLDAGFLDTEDADPHSSMAIASLAVIEGPVPRHEEIVRAIAGRLPLVKRYRQKAVRVPFDLSQPVWVDDPTFDIGYHVRTTALPEPGDDAALCRLVGRVMSNRLDRDRPLWEYWVVAGLAGGRWGLLSKVHHCIVDGVGGNELYRLLFDDSPTPRPPVPDTWQPEPPPNQFELTLDAFSERARTRIAAVEQITRALLRPMSLNRRIVETSTGLAALAGALVPGAATSLIGPIGTARRYSVARVPFADLSRVAKASGTTVNDVVLAAVTGAFRQLLLQRGERPDADALRAMVPVSVRRPEVHGPLENHVSMMLPMLPVEVADPLERLKAVHARVAALKASKEAEANDALTALAPLEDASLVSWGVRFVMRLPQRNIMTVTTNVPGPRNQLYIMGQPVVEILPYVPISGQIRFGISVMTYHGQAAFGVTGDYDSAPEVDGFAAAIAAGIGELAALLTPAVPAPVAPRPEPAPAPVAPRPEPAPARKAPAKRPAAVTAKTPARVAAARAKPATATRAVKATAAAKPTKATKASATTKAANAAASTRRPAKPVA